MTTLPFEHSRVAGTREEPYAQPRRARHQPLLLHSMAVFRDMFEMIFKHRNISTVVEVGVESGQVSSLYAELGASTVYCVDPFPTQELRASLSTNEALHLVEKPSPEALHVIPPAELYVLDGDHNYAVVKQELDWIRTHAPDAVIVLHDLLWPCSWRDLYYEPSPLSGNDKHPSSSDGPTVWHDDLTPAGLVGLGAFTSAVDAGGERNGVLAAVEDTLTGAGGEWRLELIPAVFGMGVMFRQKSPSAEALAGSLRPYSQSTLLAAMENNRIALYTRVLQLQYEAAGVAGNADSLADTIAAQRRTIEQLQVELAERTATHRAEAQALREQNRQLRAELMAPPVPEPIVRLLARRAVARLRKREPSSR